MKKYRVLRLLLGIALLPVCIGATLSLLEAINSINRSSTAFSTESISLFCGYIVWLALWFFLPRPARTYVLAHEMTHAVCGLLFGARVSNISVRESGGSVSLSKSNLWITLSPYFFPFYTVLVIVAYLVTGIFIRPVPWKPFWFFMVGFTWSFHACFTLNSLMIRQPDIQLYGRLFSYAVIYLLNLITIAAWLVVTTPVTPASLFASLIGHTRSTYSQTYDQGRRLINRAVRAVK